MVNPGTTTSFTKEYRNDIEFEVSILAVEKNLFVNKDETNCPMVSCGLYETGCSAEYSGSKLRLDSSNNLEMVVNTESRYVETICIKCIYNSL